MPPPKPAEPPLQGPERLLAEFFPASRILRRALHAVLLLDGIRDHVAHRFHPFLSRIGAKISLSLSLPLSPSIYLSLCSTHATTPLLCAQTRGTIHNKGSARRLKRAMVVVAKNRYISRLFVQPKKKRKEERRRRGRGRVEEREIAKESSRPFRVLWRRRRRRRLPLLLRVIQHNQVDELYRGHDRCR